MHSPPQCIKGTTHSAFSKMHITNLTTTSSLGKGSFCTFLWGEASKDHTSLISQPQTLGWGYDQCPLRCSGLGGSHILTLSEKVVFFLLPNSTARSQTDKSRSHMTVEFWTTFKNNIWSYFVSLSFFLKSKSKAAGTYTAKNKEKHIARYSKKQDFCLRSPHYHDKRQLNHCYNGYFIWNYTDSPIVRLEHLHCTNPQAFTY